MKRILITGAEGMIGKELRQLLTNKNHAISSADIKYGKDFNLMSYTNCLRVCKDINEVYHLAGIKGNPRMTAQRPVDFMIPMLRFDTNMIQAAQECGVKKFLYTSSIAVLNPKTDKYPAWAKKTAETLIEAMRIQYPKGTKYCIVRPANVYGLYDNFDNPDAMVITSLIKKSLEYNKILVWGDGTQERDFINARDVAHGMIAAMNKMPEVPINLCSGKRYSINDVLSVILDFYGGKKSVVYQPKEFVGDKKRLMHSNAHIIKFKPRISLEKGIIEILEAKNGS